MRHHLFLALALAAPLALGAGAQAQEPTQTPIELPEACRTAAQMGSGGQDMQKMQGDMAQAMQGMMAEMNETQKGLSDAMQRMNGPMMQGMMNKDADVAWACAMIPHHQGAVAMARAGLLGADNERSKKLAEQTIAENEKGIKDLTAWVNEHAASESKNEAATSQ